MHKYLAFLFGLFIASATFITTLHVNAQNFFDTSSDSFNAQIISSNDPHVGCQQLSQYCEQAKSINSQAEQLLSQNGYRTKFGKPSVCYTYESACRKTGCLCTREYKPVCGTDNKTYSNSCLARCVYVSIAYEGTCKSHPSSSSSSSNGQCICTMEYAPVCGVNGVTYSNRCHANCAGVAVVYNGACAGSSSSSSSMCGGIRPPCFEGSTCCTNGTWKCNNANGTSACTPSCSSCSTQFSPVCGVDGNTYSNSCFAQCNNVNISYYGTCGTQQNCERHGSCFGLTDCPSGTTCSGFPNYGCYAPNCPVPF